MEKLKLIAKRCKCGVHLSINPHRDEYVTAAQYLDDLEMDVPPTVREQIIATDTLVDLQVYPDTPIGFYKVCHHDLDTALDTALDLLREQSSDAA